MRMETEYLVTAETEEAIQAIASVWGYEFAKIDGCSFEVEGEDSQIFDIMERVMKTVHWMENGGKKENFRVVGLGDTDYDATVFSIEYDGKEPLIKASCAEPEENEERYYRFLEADYMIIFCGRRYRSNTCVFSCGHGGFCFCGKRKDAKCCGDCSVRFVRNTSHLCDDLI